MPSEDPLRDEGAALRIVMSGSRLARLMLALRGVHGMRAAPLDTQRVLVLSLILNDARANLERFLAAPGGPELLRERLSIDSSSVDFDALRALPPGTLGREYVDFLAKNGLDADKFRGPPELPPDEAYVVQRLRQTHDIWHVLLGVGTDAASELEVQGFLFAQTGARIAVAMTLAFALTKPVVMKRALRGYRRGRRAAQLAGVRWEDLWPTSVVELRRRFAISA